MVQMCINRHGPTRAVILCKESANRFWIGEFGMRIGLAALTFTATLVALEVYDAPHMSSQEIHHAQSSRAIEAAQSQVQRLRASGAYD